uniref:Uncharacterized protein n=1 Tax=Anopheles dirus TaxID=7168 RepID=A0A182NY80_9DIPT
MMKKYSAQKDITQYSYRYSS